MSASPDMQQRIVIKVRMTSQNSRARAMATAASAAGVSRVIIEGDQNDEVVVIGNKVNATALTRLLRRRVGHATLERVEVIALNRNEP